MASLDAKLAEVLPEEISDEEMERLRRKRIAEENAAAIERLAGMSSLDRPRF